MFLVFAIKHLFIQGLYAAVNLEKSIFGSNDETTRRYCRMKKVFLAPTGT